MNNKIYFFGFLPFQKVWLGIGVSTLVLLSHFFIWIKGPLSKQTQTRLKYLAVVEQLKNKKSRMADIKQRRNQTVTPFQCNRYITLLLRASSHHHLSSLTITPQLLTKISQKVIIKITAQGNFTQIFNFMKAVLLLSYRIHIVFFEMAATASNITSTTIIEIDAS